jgi:Kyanoviridae endonuclease
MSHFVYRGRVTELRDSNKHVVLLDLGFRVRTPRTFSLPAKQDPFPVGSDVIAFVSRDEAGKWMGELIPGDDENGLAMLWNYPATLMKVVDGDTIDARVDLGCSAWIDERFRLSDICAPEIFGAAGSGPDYARGVAAKQFLRDRFNESGGAMTITTSRQGKWRRWLAFIHVPGGGKCLNLQLVDAGLAVFSPAERRSRKAQSPRVSVNLEPELHERLTNRARTSGQTPGGVLHDALTEYLEP